MKGRVHVSSDKNLVGTCLGIQLLQLRIIEIERKCHLRIPGCFASGWKDNSFGVQPIEVQPPGSALLPYVSRDSMIRQKSGNNIVLLTDEDLARSDNATSVDAICTISPTPDNITVAVFGSSAPSQIRQARDIQAKDHTVSIPLPPYCPHYPASETLRPATTTATRPFRYSQPSMRS